MALSGLEIYKLLPKTNCKKCGFQTCLAFAMQLAKKAVSLDKCPFVTPDVRAILEEASQPAIRLVEIGTGDNKVCVGNETVLFRHEEKFYRPTAIGIIIEDDISEIDLGKALDEIAKLNFERVGQKLGIDLIALKDKSASKEKFIACLSKIKKEIPLNLVLMVSTPEVLKEALSVCGQNRPLVYCQDISKLEAFVPLCKQHNASLAFEGKGLDNFSLTTKKIIALGFNDLVLSVKESKLSERLWQLTQIRRMSIKKRERSLGFPTMVIVDSLDESRMACEAASAIAKYASIVLVKSRRPEYILPLLTLRQNIFTDPQKPLQVEPNVYPVGSADADSPVLVTTNFSLTYYTVLGEIESSRIPAHLVCVDTEGMSVLTAWAAEKFTPEKITDSISRFKLNDLIKHKSLIIPGYVSMMSGDLEEKSSWKIIVGPREAAGIPAFLKNLASVTS